MKTLYRNARVIDGSGSTLEDHGILVNNERVECLAPMATFEGFTGETVELMGKTLLPGLIDCHVHLLSGGEANPKAVVDKMSPGEIAIRGLLHARNSVLGGITALRDCGGRDFLEFSVRDACNRGDFSGPTIRAAGQMICMTGGHGNSNGRVADGVDEVVKAVREQIHAGCDLVKIMATGGVMTPGVNPEDAHYSAEEMAAGISEGHRFHKKSASHAQGSQGILNAVHGGIDSIEHGIFMTEECVEEMLKRGTYLVPTLSAVVNILKGADQGIPSYVVEKSLRVAEFHRKSIMMFYKAGGKIAMGTDAGTPFNIHGKNAEELANMVELGISPMDSIVFSTAHGADLIGLEEEGRVRDGAMADLLVVDGNPLEDIRMIADSANHYLVLKRGKPITGSWKLGSSPALALAAAQ
ncbi:MAG: amidohydrolase family protein [SAR324 cluster bacterium]|nr:amidohydrolase family protein [SAR324 cluster bacterium]